MYQNILELTRINIKIIDVSIQEVPQLSCLLLTYYFHTLFFLGQEGTPALSSIKGEGHLKKWAMNTELSIPSQAFLLLNTDKWAL